MTRTGRNVANDQRFANRGTVLERICTINVAFAGDLYIPSLDAVAPQRIPSQRGIAIRLAHAVLYFMRTTGAHSDQLVHKAKFDSALPHCFAPARFSPCGQLNVFKKLGTDRRLRATNQHPFALP